MKRTRIRPRLFTCQCGCGELVTNRYAPGHYQKAHRVATSYGPAHYAWKGDAARTTTKRERAQKMYPLSDCERCGAKATDRHHIDGDTGNNVRENIAILCRRCHMQVDGRLAAFVARERPIKPRGSCVNCGRVGLRTQGRCHRCHQYWWVHGTDRPAVESIAKERARLAREAACIECGRPCTAVKGRPVTGRCASCYARVARARAKGKA